MQTPYNKNHMGKMGLEVTKLKYTLTLSATATKSTEPNKRQHNLCY